ncbi:MAG TPA: hypothetical protein PKK00_03810 [Bacteroidales bacterium]|nr:hypothetical protein [Bacteroidales bacterium]HNW97523.1 hypothetical protein [Bacteroidales bacterium]HPS16569.1 hypothetical protein [Bacteroidales bacterium]HPS16577.1 hypothetical protein [Bacteroidales bacterium]
MSKQTGLIKLKGNIGGISFYKSGGEDLARRANGPSKERILKDPSFVRTRENNSEFGGCAFAAKTLRMALISVIQSKADPRVSARLTQIFKEVNLKGSGTRGQRTIPLSAARSILTGFDFNIKMSLSQVFNAPYAVTNNTARNQGTITIAAFLPKDYIEAPSGATHFRLLEAIGVVSDYAVNVNTGHYEPTDPLLNMISSVNYSAVTALNITTPATFTLAATLPGATAPTMTATVSVVQCLGIEFFQRVGTVDYMLAQGNCMKIVNVF